MKRWVKFILLPLGFLIFVWALSLLYNQLKNLSYVGIINSLKAMPSFKIILALVLALSYYLILGGYDIVAFKYIGSNVSLKPKDILFTCFVSNVLANNTGYSMLFGGSIRYRLYSTYNVSMVNVTKVLLFSSATMWLGLLAVGGFVFIFSPGITGDISFINNIMGGSIFAFFLRFFPTRAMGIVSIVALLSYVFLSILRSKPIKIFKWMLTFPNIKIVTAQILIAMCDWLVASLTFYVLMPAGYISYFGLLKVFLIAQFVVIASQVPGGIGIFEGCIAYLLPNSADNSAIVGAVLAYRAIFYLFPLLIALILLGFFEFAKRFKKGAKIFGKTLSSAMVQILALSSFFAGMIIMFSTSTPFARARLKFLINLLPLRFVDLSHFLLSTVAMAMLFISRAIQLRIKNAWNIACTLISCAIALILIAGEPPLVLVYLMVLLISLLVSRKYFYRDISILNTAFSAWWFVATCSAFVLSVWIGFFVNKQDISSWIHLDAFFKNIFNTTDAARFLRASLGMGAIIFVVILEQISKNFFKKPVSFTSGDIKNIAYSSDLAYALNALASDKNYIVNKQKDAFIMYAKSRDNWIVLGDPVGNSVCKNELLWKFKEIADSASAKPAFIGIDSKYAQIYNDIGLDIFNIGQEAKISLRAFNKEDDRFKSFCDLEEDMQSAGFKYKVLHSNQFEQYREIFADISRKWEQDANYIERNFIPGKYDDSYMKDMDFGVLEKDGKICAFSVLAKTKNKYEISSGVVRYLKCDKNVFAYIIFKNILQAKEGGYKWFDMGLAYFPAMGNNGEALKCFAKMFMFSEHFNYDLASLRNFKDKFCPVWHNKYIAIKPDKYMLSFIKNFTALISPQKFIESNHFFRKLFKR
jgi:phosphatidylglycerol lysyltransferase